MSRSGMLPSLREPEAASSSDAAAVSCALHPRCIQDGDLVIVYESPLAMKAVNVTMKGRFDNRFGSFIHKVIELPASSRHQAA